MAEVGGRLEDKVDFDRLHVMAYTLLAHARRLADWAHDDKLDETGADMLVQVAEKWLALEAVLEGNGLGVNGKWCSSDDQVCAAATCLHDLLCAVRSNSDWLKYLKNHLNGSTCLCGRCFLSLAPRACMGMPHAVFAKRLAVAVQFLEIVVLRMAPPVGTPTFAYFAPLQIAADSGQAVDFGKIPVAPTPDGPFDGKSFAWKGKVCNSLTPTLYRLLEYLWDGGKPMRSATYEQLVESVWGGKRVEWGTVKSTVCRLDKNLNHDGIYLNFETGTEYYVRVEWASCK